MSTIISKNCTIKLIKLLKPREILLVLVLNPVLKRSLVVPDKVTRDLPIFGKEVRLMVQSPSIILSQLMRNKGFSH
jgi:hypothetical protein